MASICSSDTLRPAIQSTHLYPERRKKNIRSPDPEFSLILRKYAENFDQPVLILIHDADYTFPTL